MKSIQPTLFKSLGLFLLTFFVSTVYAQNWKANIPTWHAPADVITASPTTGNSTTYTFAPYNNWTYLEYDVNGGSPLTVSNLTVTFGLQSTSSNLFGKYLLVQLVDASGYTSQLDISTLLAIAAPDPANPTVQPAANLYSLDFSTVAFQKNFNPTSIKGLTFVVMTDGSMRTSANNLNGDLLVSNVTFGNGTIGTSYTTNATLSQEWELQTNGFLAPANPKHGVLIGNPTNNGMEPLLTSPYYNFIVNGRTNFIGNDNAFSIWSANLPASGYRHYLGFTNATFPSTTTEYSMINAYEYNSGYALGNPKHLTLQNFSTGGGNLGIGQFSSAPLAKLHVNGNVLIGTKQPAPGVSYLLGVAGQIAAQSVVVTAPSSWADFVFKKSYTLPDLETQERYIKQHGHLQGVPSETEVLEKGYDITQMDAKLLQKIEELTLYMIDMKKEINALKKENAALKNK